MGLDKLIGGKKFKHSVILCYSWHGLVVFGVIMVTIGVFIFGLTTTNSIYQDVVS